MKYPVEIAVEEYGIENLAEQIKKHNKTSFEDGESIIDWLKQIKRDIILAEKNFEDWNLQDYIKNLSCNPGEPYGWVLDDVVFIHDYM